MFLDKILPINEKLNKAFHISERGSTIATECQAALTTFLTMAYILLVNPQILSDAIQIDGVSAFPQLMTVTAFTALVGSLLMGLLANYPFAVAPGMGMNAFFTYTIVLGKGASWEAALGAVVISGVLFIIITASGIREMIVRSIPLSLKHAMGAGIGLFLATIGLTNAGIVVPNSATLTTLGDLSQPGPLLAMLGLLIAAVLLSWRTRGAMLISIVVVSTLAVLLKLPVYDGKAFAGFSEGLVRLPVWPGDIMGAFDLKAALDGALLGVIFTILFVNFFDTAGTLYALASRVGYVDSHGNLPRASHAFMSDAVATTTSGLMGCSPATAYIESAAGIEEGGRTGLTAIVVSVLFACSLFLWPLAMAVPKVATAPALIVVGAMMLQSAKNIPWDNYRHAIPAFLTLIGMPLTYSIADGIAFGVISYSLIHLACGKWHQVHWIMYVMTPFLILVLGYQF